jgi:hypothetical protein
VEASPSPVYGARLLSGLRAETLSRVRIPPPPLSTATAVPLRSTAESDLRTMIHGLARGPKIVSAFRLPVIGV